VWSAADSPTRSLGVGVVGGVVGGVSFSCTPFTYWSQGLYVCHPVFCGVAPSFNWPSTPQFGQPSKFAPAGTIGPRALSGKKKRIGVKNLVRQSGTLPKENKLGVNKYEFSQPPEPYVATDTSFYVISGLEWLNSRVGYWTSARSHHRSTASCR
jgi:hypothetical protein